MTEAKDHAEPSAKSIALSLRKVHKAFGPTPIIRGVDLDIRQGERHALIGPNGAGKSTLFHLISGRMPPTSGEIFLGSRKISGLRPYQINRLGLSRSFQITNIFPKISVVENLRCALFWPMKARYGFWSAAARVEGLEARADDLLAQIGLAARRDAPAGVLTYAEQRALEIGLAIASGAQTILLDEPMAGMSLSETQAVMELIRKVSEGRTLLMVEHDMGVVFKLADRISVLVYGQIIATGSPQEIRDNPAVREAYLGQAQT